MQSDTLSLHLYDIVLSSIQVRTRFLSLTRNKNYMFEGFSTSLGKIKVRGLRDRQIVFL